MQRVRITAATAMIASARDGQHLDRRKAHHRHHGGQHDGRLGAAESALLRFIEVDDPLLFGQATDVVSRALQQQGVTNAQGHGFELGANVGAAPVHRQRIDAIASA